MSNVFVDHGENVHKNQPPPQPACSIGGLHLSMAVAIVFAMVGISVYRVADDIFHGSIRDDEASWRIRKIVHMNNGWPILTKDQLQEDRFKAELDAWAATCDKTAMELLIDHNQENNPKNAKEFLDTVNNNTKVQEVDVISMENAKNDDPLPLTALWTQKQGIITKADKTTKVGEPALQWLKNHTGPQFRMFNQNSRDVTFDQLAKLLDDGCIIDIASRMVCPQGIYDHENEKPALAPGQTARKEETIMFY